MEIDEDMMSSGDDDATTFDEDAMEVASITTEAWESDGTLVLEDGSEDGSPRGSISSEGSYEARSDVSSDYGGETIRYVKRSFHSFGFFDLWRDAVVARGTVDDFVYTHDTHYDSSGVHAKVFKCRSHLACPYRMKIILHKVSSRYELVGGGGVHKFDSPIDASAVRIGIAAVIKDEADSLLLLGLGAGRVRNMLLFKYLDNASILHDVPSAKQLENRKARLKKTFVGGWQFETFASLMGWCASRMCQSRDAFVGNGERDLRYRSELLVLDTFTHQTTVDGVSVQSFGMIFTSRAVFENVRTAARDQDGSLVLSTDGTYRIHFGDWTLVDCGSVCVEYSRGRYAHSFRPWLYMFVRTESKEAYTRMFDCVIKYARSFYGIDVSVASSSIHHSDAIASALESTWPDGQIVTCWPHLVRQARKKASLLVDKSFHDNVVVDSLRLLHAARSHEQFLSLAKIIIASWKKAKETRYADWLSSVYLTDRWCRWSVNSSAVAGFLPSQQPIESHHAVIKTIVTDYKKAPTVTVLNSVIPRILLYATTNLSSPTCRHFAEGPIPHTTITKAKLFLIEKPNHLMKFPRGVRDVPRTIFFNSSRSMVRLGHLAGSPVDEDRVRLFKASLSGRVPTRTPVSSLRFDFLSLHAVTVDRAAVVILPRLSCKPIYSASEIQMIRDAFVCSCKAHMLSGWICSHVTASLHLVGRLDIAVADTPVQPRLPPGRKKQPSGSRENVVLSVDRYVEMFLKDPGRVLMWPIVEEFTVNDAGVERNEHRVGQVSTVRMGADGNYVWTVEFLAGNSLEYEVQELASAVRLAVVMRSG